MVHWCSTTNYIYLYCIICRADAGRKSLWWRSTGWIIHVCLLARIYIMLWKVPGRRNDVKSYLQGTHVIVWHPLGLLICFSRKIVLMTRRETYSEVWIVWSWQCCWAKRFFLYILILFFYIYFVKVFLSTHILIWVLFIQSQITKVLW